jgi:Tfp pilus assembly protein PilO
MMLALQTPLPPDFPIRAQETILIAMTIIAITTAAIFVLRPLIRAFARRIEGRTVDSQLKGEVEQLHEQVAELEPLQRRVLELEERIEFTERLLAQRRDGDLLPREGSGPR